MAKTPPARTGQSPRDGNDLIQPSRGALTTRGSIALQLMAEFMRNPNLGDFVNDTSGIGAMAFALADKIITEHVREVDQRIDSFPG